MELQNKVALVIGASSGIGRAAAVLFAKKGAKVIVGARRQGALDDLVAEIAAAGGSACAVAGDACDEAYAKELCDAAVSQYGGLDIALHCAGALGTLAPATELSTANWHNVIDANLTSAFLGAKHQLPLMEKRGGGSLILTSSFVGYTAGMPGMAAYAAAKAGMVGLMKCLAVEYGPKGIRVNALLPGGTDTDMAAEFASTPEEKAFVRSLHVLGRIATPMEIAHSALYLASDASSFTTGHAMLVDGGVSIKKA